MRLNIKSFATTCGLVWGGGVLCYAWWRMLFGEGGEDETMIGHVYRGFKITPMGSLVGSIWALADGFTGGAVFAWLYNRLCDHMPVNVKM